jgi:hypothetical protein
MKEVFVHVIIPVVPRWKVKGYGRTDVVVCKNVWMTTLSILEEMRELPALNDE